MPVPCQYILPLMSFIIINQEIFERNAPVHTINTRNKNHLCRPNANLSYVQNSTFYAGIKIFNRLPPSMTILKNDKAKFKAASRKYLRSTYTLHLL
jgi:hypothetical protein